jgi:hypothetical protein
VRSFAGSHSGPKTSVKEFNPTNDRFSRVCAALNAFGAL